MPNKKIAARVLQETGYVLQGNVKYHTYNQVCETGIHCYYEATNGKGYKTYVMFGDNIRTMVKAKKWSISQEIDGISIDIEL